MTDKLLKKAINKHKAGQHAVAQSLYKKILKSHPDHIDANYMLGTSLAETGQATAALKYVEQAERQAPDSQYIKNNLGNVYRMLGDYENAAEKYVQALSIQPDMTQALNNLAIVQRRLNNNQQAIALYKSAIAANPEFLEAHYNLGKSYWDEGQYDNAFACYQRVLELDPGHALATHEMGNYYMQLKDNGKAISCFEKYLELVDKDTCGANLKLSYLKGGQIPDRQPEQLVIQTYEKKARTWDQDVERADMAFLGPQHIEHALADLKLASDNLNVLDIGCGTGLCGTYLRNCASQLHGVDLSRQMLALAEKKKLYDQLVCGDIIEYISSTKNNYDLIVGSGVLIFFGDLQDAVTKIAQKILPSGHFVFTLYESKHNDIEIRDNMHFAHSEKYIEQVAKQAGLHIKQIKPVIHEYEHEQPQPGFVVSLCK